MSISAKLGGHLVPFWVPTPPEYLQESYQQQRDLPAAKWIHVHTGRQVSGNIFHNENHLKVIFLPSYFHRGKFQFAIAKEIGLEANFQ